MSDTYGVDGSHTVAQGDVEVTRRLETDGRAVIGHIQLRSTAAEPVVVELVDQIPSSLSVESAAFDPDCGPDDGTAGTAKVRVEQEVGEDTERVVYGLMLASPPEDVSFDAPAVRELPRPEAPVADGGVTDDDAPDTAGEPLSLRDPSEEQSTDGEATGVEEPTGNDADAAPSEREEESRSVALRVDRLSARVEEFATYAEAMEAFIDERGTADEFAERIEGRVDDATADVADLRADLDAELTAVREEVAEVDREVENLRSEVEETRAETASLREEVAEVRELRSTLAAAFGGGDVEDSTSTDTDGITAAVAEQESE